MSIIDDSMQGFRIFVSSMKNRIHPQKFEGNAEVICRQIVKNCWNGRFFQTSVNNFPQFWTRDFGWCVQSLINLKYEQEVHQTLRYALNRFKKARKVTAILTPHGKAIDFPVRAVDSLPWLIHAIKVSKFPYYSYRHFLNYQINRFFKEMVDSEKGLVKLKHFSSIKDHAIRKSSCYDNCMVAMLAKDLEQLKLDNPFKNFNYSDLLKKHFWNGKFFFDDLNRRDYVAGDANLFPFLLGIINNKEMLKLSIVSIQEAKLDDPFPLKYTSSREGVKFIWQELFARNYESNSIWMHLGLLYVKLMQQVDRGKALEHKKKYGQLIEKHNNLLEVFDSCGKPYSSLFYYCDSGMLWAANYLAL